MSLVLTVCCAHCIFWLHFVVALVNSSRCFLPFTLLDHFIFKMSAVTWEEEKVHVYLLKTDGKKWRYICTCCLAFLFFVILCKMCIKHVCWTKQTVLKSNLKSCGCTNTKPVKKNKLTEVKFTWDELGWTYVSVTNLQTGSTVEPGAKILSQSPQTPVLKSTTIQQK